MVKKPDTHIVIGESPEYGELTAMRILWRACIAQAIRDLICVNVEDALDSAQWIGSPDFIEVCDSADVEPDWLEEKIRKAMALSMPYRRHAILRLSQDMNIGLTSGIATERD
ncbi:hypothetical protein UFOVP28_71 [uncultured Caudovirales phage]|uniref:Uncharacterized protein n=1 Tax=uncultured Caudovirales phage TaxID=2100421 RepID=A0A6J5KSA6_9CAUD|nr:hypothetical protein UFOVP28_71 [uncultured Caudovirales phage]